MIDPDIEEAIALMNRFAERTGLSTDRSPRRYLWTDAFALCNLLGLAGATGDKRFEKLALTLVEQVHHSLGRHRNDDRRRGWISGLKELDGEAHPTRGGLRIGKDLPERGPEEPFDEHLEWERDGQYFHYLTKWMQALDQLSRSTGEARFNTWARELAAVTHRAFVYEPSGTRPSRMYWKMSIDLSRPLVSTMGQHDPLDGYLTVIQLRATAAGLSQVDSGPDLEDAARQFAALLERAELVSPDPLGIGGLLVDAYRAAQLQHLGHLSDTGLIEHLLTAALKGLRYYAAGGELQAPARYRLAFRELGLAIGVRAANRMWQESNDGRQSLNPRVRARLEVLHAFKPLGDEIESFWRQPRNQNEPTWLEHRDINEVMLATRLAPEGYLVLKSRN